LRCAIRAEVTKLLSLRSIRITLLAALLLPPALAYASGHAFDPASPAAASFPTESHGFETAGFGQPLIILFAALVTGSEFLGNELRSTLLATPHRGRVLAAKSVVIVVPAALVGFIATGLAVLVKHAVLGYDGLTLSQFTWGMGRNLLGVAINYALIAVIAAAITMLSRAVIVALVVLIPLVLGLTLSLLGPFPALRYLPDLAGLQLLTGYPGVGLLEPVPGGFVMVAWATVLGLTALAVFRIRDVG
jgi:ABC-2 type transport system permease protein